MSNSGTYLAVAAACIARGLDADEADAVWEELAPQVPAGAVFLAYRQLTTAIDKVIAARGEG